MHDSGKNFCIALLSMMLLLFFLLYLGARGHNREVDQKAAEKINELTTQLMQNTEERNEWAHGIATYYNHEEVAVIYYHLASPSYAGALKNAMLDKCEGYLEEDFSCNEVGV